MTTFQELKNENMLTYKEEKYACVGDSYFLDPFQC